MTNYIHSTDRNKLIRKVLKEAFPETAFSVRKDSVNWIDGPTTDQVSLYLDRFEGAGFDGMTDSTTYHYSTLDGEKVCFADYLFLNRDYSGENIRQSALSLKTKMKLTHSVDELIENQYNRSFLDANHLENAFIHKYMYKRSRVIGKPSPTAERIQPWIDPGEARQEALESQRMANRIQMEEYYNQLWQTPPLEPQPIIAVGQRLGLACPHLNKQSSIGEYVRQLNDPDCYSIELVEVEQVFVTTPEIYDRLIFNLLDTIPQIGRGGTSSDFELDSVDDYLKMSVEEQALWRAQSYLRVTAVSAPNRRTFFTDAQGYDYARYCLFFPPELELSQLSS